MSGSRSNRYRETFPCSENWKKGHAYVQPAALPLNVVPAILSIRVRASPGITRQEIPHPLPPSHDGHDFAQGLRCPSGFHGPLVPPFSFLAAFLSFAASAHAPRETRDLQVFPAIPQMTPRSAISFIKSTGRHPA